MALTQLSHTYNKSEMSLVHSLRGYISDTPTPCLLSCLLSSEDLHVPELDFHILPPRLMQNRANRYTDAEHKQLLRDW